MVLSNGQLMYSLPQAKRRALLPKIISLLFLSVIFYIGVVLNLILLDLGSKEQTTIKTITLFSLLIIIGLGLILAVSKANQKYLFYREGIIKGKKSIYYINIANTAPKKDLMDKIFHTYSIDLGEDFHLRHIDEKIDLESYLKQLIDYSRKAR